MTKIFALLATLLLLNVVTNAQKGGTREIYTWTINDSTDFQLKSISLIWGHNFELSTNYCGATLVDTTINVPSNNSSYLYGWDNVVLNCSPTNAPPYFGYALYEVIINDDRLKFYFDTRDADYDGSYPCGNDFYFKYNFAENSLIIETGGTCYEKIVLNLDYISIWEISEKTEPPITYLFENFWQNCLLLIDDGGNHPHLVWGAYPAQVDIAGYRVYRIFDGGPPVLLTTTDEMTFDYIDNTITFGAGAGVAYYYVKALYSTEEESEASNTVFVLTDEHSSYKTLPGLSENKPIEYSLEQNYPNPFNPSTLIKFTLPQSEFVKIKVFNQMGEQVALLASEQMSSGTHSINFDGTDLASGIYFYQISAGKFNEVRKMMLLK